MKNDVWHVETTAIHAGEPRPRFGGAVNVPVFQSSTFEHLGDSDYHDVRYIRLNNTPNHLALGEKLAALEGGEAGLVAASGMAAISATLLSLLRVGDHMIAHDCLYGGTHSFFTKDLPAMGVEVTFVDAGDRSSWEKAKRPTTRVFYVETMTNPLLEVVDLEAVVDFCRAAGIASVIDNTCATPINYRPLQHGFDCVVHSATKYLNGHSDIVAGAVVGKTDAVMRVKQKLDHLGGSLDPHACYLLHRGLKTLPLRVRHQNESALRLTQFLAQHPAVARAHYPGLEGHPHHARAKRWFSGCAGLFSFELKGGLVAAERFFRRAQIPLSAPSLGGPETLMTRPVTTSHVGLSAEERARQGITEGLIRVSVGLESTDDLIADFAQALQND